MNFFNFLSRNYMEVLQVTLDHMKLVGISIAIAVAIGIPLGILIVRKKKLRRWVLGFANVMQTVPSLALFGFLIPVPFIGGIGNKTAIVALVVYSLLPIIRNTFTGISSVDPAVVEAARGLGMTDWQLLRHVELPLALSMILAGVRVATVIAVGLATIAGAIGADGLGTYIFRGINMVNNHILLAGAIPAAILALLADTGLGWLERRLKAR